MNDQEKLSTQVQVLKNNMPMWTSRYVKIRPKGGGKPIPFVFNKAQTTLHTFLENIKAQGFPIRVAVVKGRQQGVSTYIAARFLHRATLNRGVSVFILAHISKSTDYLFDMVKRMYSYLPDILKPSIAASNKKELKFGAIDSEYALGSAESREIGRGMTPLLLHCCLAEGTKVFKSNGDLTNIEELIEGDKVRTHKNKMGEISLISEQIKSCFSVKVDKNKTPINATGGHKLLTPTGFKTISSLTVGDEVGFPIKKIKSTEKVLKLKRNFRGNGLGGGVREDAPEYIDITFKLGRVLGLYLAEGFLCKQQKRGTFSGVSFAVHRREVKRTKEWLGEIKEMFSSLNVYHRKDSLTSVVTVYGTSFANLVFKLCGRTKTKIFPEHWDTLGTDFAEGLMFGYVSGDGHFNIKDRLLCTTSVLPTLSYGLRDILVSLGYGWASVEFNPAAIRYGRNEQAQYPLRLGGNFANELGEKLFGRGKPYKRKKNGGFFRYRITDGFVWQKIKSIEPIGEQRVFDLEVNHEDHSYCVQQCATHNSEAAFYNNTTEIQTGLLQGIPNDPNSEIIYESTANGVLNMFYGLCMKGVENKDDLSRVQTLFLPWFWQPEYRMKVPVGFIPSLDEAELMDKYGLDLMQIVWRRTKIEDTFNGDLWMFRQEYPMFLLDAFVTSGEVLIKGEYIEAGRKTNITPDEFAPKVLGVDGADSGDRTALVLRQGKKVLWYKVYKKMKPMMLAGIIAQRIDKEDIDMVFLDVAYGYGARDRLKELGYGSKTQCVHFGEKALEPEIYKNKRAQMYGYLKEWFMEGGSDIPDDNLFARDMQMVPDFEQSGSRGLLSLPSKVTIRKNNAGVSPDISDAAGLTFAYPVMRRATVARVQIKDLNNSRSVSVFRTRRNASQRPIKQNDSSELFIK